MKNILNEKPTEKLEGRLAYTTKFVDLNDINGKNILNIGCGFGWFELFALKNNPEKISAIEITEEDLKTAKESIIDRRVKFKIGSAIKIPYPDNTFDTIVSWEVIEHIPKNTEKEMMKEISRVLKLNGVLYLSTPHKNFLSCVLDPAWWLISHRHYSLEQLEEFTKNNGLELDKFAIKGGMWSLLTMINLYVSKWIFRRNLFFKQLFTSRMNNEYESNSTGCLNIFVKFNNN